MEPVLQELRVLLEYLVKHNQDHATELIGLAARVEKQGSSEAHAHMARGIELLNESNRSLRAALDALED